MKKVTFSDKVIIHYYNPNEPIIKIISVQDSIWNSYNMPECDNVISFLNGFIFIGGLMALK